jgi:hypothetical protein
MRWFAKTAEERKGLAVKPGALCRRLCVMAFAHCAGVLAARTSLCACVMFLAHHATRWSTAAMPTEAIGWAAPTPRPPTQLPAAIPGYAVRCLLDCLLDCRIVLQLQSS